MKYRSEIDGLRAIAVVPVILFHAGFEIFSGGFVGVDVFFVISGYLITTIIINEMDEGKFSLLNFYERRARRILPALFFVVLCCLPFAWFLLLPSDMKDFSQSLVAVATFSSNILFWRESGYFDTAAELKPLLHTWSLAVEEQFYILFPLFLMAAWRFGKRAIVWTLVAAFVISLATAQWGAYNKPAATFYLLPTRAWELLIGSFAAFYLQKRPVTAPLWMSNALSAVGLAAILYSVFAFDEATPFPSVYALAPTVGTVLIILFAMRGTAVHALLSLKAFVGVGLISYSLYLWHQPVFAFWRHYNVFEPTHLQMVMLSLLCFVLAYATFQFVESVFRLKRSKIHRRQIFTLSVSGMLFMLCWGVVGHTQAGFSSRFENYADLEIYNEMRQPEGGCISGFFATELEHCLLGKAGGETNIIAVGDSHMHQWADVFDEIAKNNEISIELIAKSACAVPDISEYFYGRLGRNYTECNIWRQSLIEYLQSTKPSLLVIQVSSMGYINSEITLQDWTAGLRRFLKQLSNDVNVLWILDNPRFPFDPRRCISEQIIREAQSIDCSTRRSLAISAELQDAEVSVLNEFGAKVLDLTEFFCSETQCYSFINDMPVMSDTNHVTQGFLRSLMSEVEQHLILR